MNIKSIKKLKDYERLGKILIFVIFLNFCNFFNLFNCLYSEPGTTAFNFLKIATGIKGVGMGEAFTAVADDATGAVYWNPAGLSQIKYQGITAGYTKWFQEINYQTISFVQPSDVGNFAGSISNFSFGDIDGYRYDGTPTDKLNAFNRSFIFSYAIPIAKQKIFSVGLNAKVIQEKLDDKKVEAFAIDFGSLYHPLKWVATTIPLSLGFSFQNIGSSIKFIKEKYLLPFNIKLGVGYKLFSDALILAVDYNIPKDNVEYYNVGTEYQFLDIVKIRAGYRFRDTESGIRFGIGTGSDDVCLDYAFVPYGVLGDTHRFGLSVYFGKTHRLDTAQSKIEKYLKKGKNYFSKNDFISALKEFKSVLIYDPTHQEAQKYLNKIKECVDEINVEKYLDSGKKHLERGEHMKAKEEFENILTLVPENEQAKNYLAMTENKIIEERNRRLDVLFSQGIEFYNREEYEDAIGLWEKVLRVEPEHSNCKEYISRARVEIEKRKKTKFEQQIKILYENAVELYEKVKYKKSLDLFEDVSRKTGGQYLDVSEYIIKTKEKVAQMYFKEGLKLYENNFFKEAYKIFEKSLEYFPEYKEAADCINKCKEKIKEELEKQRVVADEYNRKGLIEYNQGNLKEAIKFFEKALESNPEHATAKKNFERARKELKK